MEQARAQFLIPLDRANHFNGNLVGGKAWNLSRLLDSGFSVPPGTVLTTFAYREFLASARLVNFIAMELDRKPLGDMRWEELWDAALRIRSAFMKADIPGTILSLLPTVIRQFGQTGRIIVRSSAPGEDSRERSFAGLHESIVVGTDIDQVADAIRQVWASLWSDAALLYRSELGLDPRNSSMAVLIQEFRVSSPSGIVFGRDPRNLTSEVAIIEAVPGCGSDLVDGLVDPDRWDVALNSKLVTNYRAGSRAGGVEEPLLDHSDISRLMDGVQQAESLLGWFPDIEWTGRNETLSYVQARPITTGAPETLDDERRWLLSLRPGAQKLAKLCERVSEHLIPELQAEGERLASANLEDLTDRELAAEIKNRLTIVKKWKKVYSDEFIPFAHGVRQLGTYYNDALKPDDPYEFLGLLRGEGMLATRRNQTLAQLAQLTSIDGELHAVLSEIVLACTESSTIDWPSGRLEILGLKSGPAFVQAFDSLLDGYMDVSYTAERLHDHPEVFLYAILEQCEGFAAGSLPQQASSTTDTNIEILEQRLLGVLPPERHDEAREVIRIARISWRLRDDDNLLVGRLESQLLRAVSLAAVRLRSSGHLVRADRLNDEVALVLAEALVYPPDDPINIESRTVRSELERRLNVEGKPRQLVGQPGSPGLATGLACIVRSTQDLLRFKAGSVLVCDAIQPTMTHIVPLACAIVERRGGMLIHGAIIARELRIPCVNGVASAVELIRDRDILSVDGHLGIVTVGPPEFDAELGTGIAKELRNSASLH